MRIPAQGGPGFAKITNVIGIADANSAAARLPDAMAPATAAL
jgi:hypothetical protein